MDIIKNQDFEQVFQEYIQRAAEQLQDEEIQQDVQGKDHIVAVRKNDDGDIIAFKTDSGRELDYLTALDEAKAGKLNHVDVFHKYGRDIIRSEPDGISDNNLDNLPLF